MDSALLRNSLAIAIAMLGAIVVIGWLGHLPRVVQGGAGLAAMTLATALCFLSLGVALLAPEPPRSHSARIQRILALVVMLLAAAMIVENLGDLDFGMDLPWPQRWLDPNNTRPGRMSISTA